MKKLFSTRRKAGFTLVEALVYIFIFLLISIGAIGLLFSLDDLFVQYKLKQALLASGNSMMERVLLESREAESVVLADSILASSTSGILSLDRDGETLRFEQNGSQLEFYRGGNLETVLGGELIEVVGVTFYHYETAEGVELVRVKLELRAVLADWTEEWELNGGVILRGSYGSS
jgi:type II secretory pathway pseudopilin PulG